MYMLDMGMTGSDRDSGKGPTKEKLILVHDISDTEVKSTEEENERLSDTIQECDGEDKDGLWIDDPIVDHWWRIELGEVYKHPARE